MSDALLTRTPPAAVRRQLRQEAGFSCPVAGCGDIFLEYHHFDPPWEEHRHHRPEGMIALCPKCHRAADVGKWSRGELRRLKSDGASIARGRMRWDAKNLIVRVGGNWIIGSITLLKIDEQPVLGVDLDEFGNLAFSCKIVLDGNPVIEIDKNDVTVLDRSIYDVEAAVSQQYIKINVASRRVMFEAEFRRSSVFETLRLAHKDLADVPNPITGISQLDTFRNVLANSTDDELRIPVLSVNRLVSTHSGVAVDVCADSVALGPVCMQGSLIYSEGLGGGLINLVTKPPESVGDALIQQP